MLTTLEAQEEPAVFLFRNRHSCKMSPLTASGKCCRSESKVKKIFFHKKKKKKCYYCAAPNSLKKRKCTKQ